MFCCGLSGVVGCLTNGLLTLSAFGFVDGCMVGFRVIWMGSLVRCLRLGWPFWLWVFLLWLFVVGNLLFRF